MSEFPQISDYGFLSDGEVSALLAPSGAIEWLPLPRFDSPSVFSALLHRRAGSFRLGPEGVFTPAEQRYIPGTLILETTWQTKDGWLVVKDVLLMGPWEDDRPSQPRTPTDYTARHVLLRTVKCLYGEVQLSLDCKPIFSYGRDTGEWSWDGDTYHSCSVEGEDIALRLHGDIHFGIEGSRVAARTLLREGDERFVALAWSGGKLPQDIEEAKSALVWTSHHWKNWLGRGNFPDHPWRRYLERSALVLKGLTYSPTGALIAAPTTSLPEEIGGERNWDYRYSWIRDSVLMLWGLYSLGFTWEANDYFYFLSDIAAKGDDLHVVYDVLGSIRREITKMKTRMKRRI